MKKNNEKATVSTANQTAEQTEALVNEVVANTTIGVEVGEQKSLYAQIVSVGKKFLSYHQEFEKTNTVKFKNKEEPTEVLTQAEFIEACLAGKNAGDYEPTVVTVDPKAELKALIFNDSEPKSSKHLSAFLSAFTKACEVASGFQLSEVTKSYATYEEALPVAPVKKEKSAFAKSIAAINARITKAKADGKPDEEAKIRLERVNLYIKEGVTPRVSFKDMDLYNQALKEKSSVEVTETK